MNRQNGLTETQHEWLTHVIFNGSLHPNSVKILARSCKTVREMLVDAKCIVYRLTAQGSVHFMRDVNFRQHLERSGTITNACLTDVTDPDLEAFSEVKRLYINNSEITDVFPLRRLLSLLLIRCHKLTELTVFSQLHSIVLHDCPEIKNVAELGNVRNVIITKCPKVEDVSPLRRVYNLQLKECQGIHDVGPLQNVKYLFIGGCCNIRSFDDLTNVEFLEIGWSRNLTSTVHFKSSVYLKLEHCYRLERLEGIDVHRLKTIYLEDCFGLTDVGVLEGISRVFLLRCPNVRDLTPLCRCDFLHLRGFDFPEANKFAEVRELWIENNDKLVDVSGLSKTETLVVRYCHRLRDVRSVSGLPSVRFAWCHSLTGFLAFLETEKFVIQGCTETQLLELSNAGMVDRILQ